MNVPRGGVRAAAGAAGALAGAALTPFLVGLLPDPACDDTVAAACAAREVTVGWLVLCALVGAVVAVVLVTALARRRPEPPPGQ